MYAFLIQINVHNIKYVLNLFGNSNFQGNKYKFQPVYFAFSADYNSCIGMNPVMEFLSMCSMLDKFIFHFMLAYLCA